MKDYGALSFASQSESTKCSTQLYNIAMEYKIFFHSFDQIFYYVHFPSIVDDIIFVWLGCQVLFTSFWITHSNVWDYSELSSKIILTINKIVNFRTIETNVTSFLYTFFVYLFIFACSIGHLVFQIICSKTRGRIVNSTLYTTKIFVFYLPVILIHPLAIFCGNLLKFIVIQQEIDISDVPKTPHSENFNVNNSINAQNISRFAEFFGNIGFGSAVQSVLNKASLFDDETQNNTSNKYLYIYALFTFSILFFIYFEIIFFMSFKLFSYSTYLPNSFLASFDFSPIILMILFSSISQLFSCVLIIFPEWSIYFLISLHSFLAGYALLKNIRGRLISRVGNSMVFSVIFNCIILDIIRLLFIAVEAPNAFYFMGFICFSCILSFLVSYFVYGMKDRRMCRQIDQIIDEYGDENLGKIEIRQKIFEDLGMVKSSKKSFEFIEFFVKYQKYQFIDFITIKFMQANHQSKHNILKLMRIFVQFPCLTSYLNVLSLDLMGIGNISIFGKFLIYEIQRIKIHRQSSSSVAAGESLKLLTCFGKEIESNIKFFWEQKKLKPQVLYGISTKINKLQILWEEEISHFQNSAQHYVNYERFLIECKTDFSGAIYQLYRKQLIEGGFLFKVDKCYAMFVQLFPEYLKKRIMSASGRFIVNQKDKIGSTNNSTGNPSFMSQTLTSSSSEIDVLLEQSLGKSLFSHSRLRLALQNSTKDRVAISSIMMQFGIYVSLITSICFSVFIYLNFRPSLDNRSETADRIGLARSARFYSFLSGMAILYSLFDIQQTNEYNNVTNLGPFPPIFHNYSTWEELSVSWNYASIAFFGAFIEDVVSLAASGVNIYKYSPVLVEKVTRFPVCRKSSKFNNGKNFEQFSYGNINQVFLYTSLSQALSASLSYVNNNTKPDLDQIFSNENICTMLNSSYFLPDAFLIITLEMQSYILSESKAIGKHLLILKNTIPLSFWGLNILIFATSVTLYSREIKYFMSTLMGISPQAKMSAVEQIHKEPCFDEITAVESSYSNLPIIGTLILIITIFFVIGILEYINLDVLLDTNVLFQYMQHWSADAGIRKANVVEMLYWVLVRIIMQNSAYQSNYLYPENVTEAFYTAWLTMKTSSGRLMSNTIESTVPIGYSHEIDSVLLNQWCESTGETTFHDLYHCASSQQLLSIYGTVLTEVMLYPEKEINGSTFALSEVMLEAPHMVGVHILPLMRAIDDSFDTFSNEKLNQLYTLFDIYLPVEIILIFVAIFLLWRLKKILDSIYEVILMIMRRVPPNYLLSEKLLISYLFNKKMNNQKISMTTDQQIVHSSKDAILCIDEQGIINIVNPSVSKLVGFTPEQLLGQPISIIFGPDDEKTIENQLAMMLNKQCSSIYEGNVNCITDEDTLVDCSITILTIKNQKTSQYSFVIILCDQRSLIQQQQIAKEAKKQSEALLYQILPRDIVFRLNQGEKDISFNVPCATIMFIDIVKFSDYSASLAAQDIMHNLSVIFGSFDHSITKYKLLIKIKLIGDVYMCAGGLFNHDEHPSSHAVQMAQFGLEVLQDMEDVNMKLNSGLNVRIGMNTGGPLIAGVLGSDKPAFDIIGDPINVASRLQSTDLPGNIQISQASFQLLQGHDFQIEPRGEIMLKGKGKVPTYLLMPYKVGVNSEQNYHT
ncbi:Adenylate and Guanylate cyclase catalytic domain containing protein [Tritrichomonas foetus]|uniref:Adenylate and Guanylate cyclase catalytic domain containing protein n=1 Tax=Tritrichomonas foetus TaxID=1144522 RepID=A0A1J4JF05_9EUKA|nr:Adenylate and Guanylate cyclase catalytic domain containing protein [Tritrichomonas foetus]|eukprot:OHS96879.1 Adenylate and Guanylate cyclase catalytic domain containing protein [Tritrichomonas foetus]